MKPKGAMNQAVTKVNDVSPEMANKTEVDAVFICGRQHNHRRKWQDDDSSVGVSGDGMVQDGISVNLGYLHNSAGKQYAETSPKRRGLAEDCAEVGLGDSTRSEIRTRTRGSIQQLDDNFSTRLAHPLRLCA